MVRKSPHAQHEDLQGFVAEIEAELDGLVFEYPDPSVTNTPNLPSLATTTPGPLTASVTTKTMFSDGPVDPESPDPEPDTVVPEQESTSVPTPEPEDVPAKPKRTYTRKPKETADAPKQLDDMHISS
jgi:hypothetical protein